MIIAECCSNHGGDMDLARRMILSAKENGADLVKFQLYDAEGDKGKPHYEWVKKAELSFAQAKMLFDYGAGIGIEIFFSVFGVKYVDWCEKLGVERYKIACDFRDESVLNAVQNTGKPIIISFSIPYLSKLWFMPHRALYCISKYPTDIKPIKMPVFTSCDCRYSGYSDHAIGLDVAKIALACGAQIIEKHFILDWEHSQSPERKWSMIPDELKELKRWETVCQKVLG